MTQVIPGQRVSEQVAALVLRYQDVLRDELEAHKKAREASAEYVRISDKVDAFCLRKGLDSYSRWKKRNEDWEMTNAFNGWHFWQREALRLQAERDAIKERIKLLTGKVMI